MSMHIFFTGSHSTGKTTIAEKIHQSAPHRTKLMTNIARSIIREGLPLGENATVESYVALLGLRMQYLRQCSEHKFDYFVWDRSILDTLAYEFTNQRLQKSPGNDHILRLLREATLAELSIPHKLFYVPIEFEMEHDGVRDEDPEYHKEVDSSLTTLLSELNISAIEISGDIESRFQKIMREIEK